MIHNRVCSRSALEVWEFINQQEVAAVDNTNSSGMAGMDHSKMGGMNMGSDANNQGMMNDFMAHPMPVHPMPVHPMHVHGVQFQVIERQLDPAYAAGWETPKLSF